MNDSAAQAALITCDPSGHDEGEQNDRDSGHSVPTYFYPFLSTSSDQAPHGDYNRRPSKQHRKDKQKWPYDRHDGHSRRGGKQLHALRASCHA